MVFHRLTFSKAAEERERHPQTAHTHDTTGLLLVYSIEYSSLYMAYHRPKLFK
jgi:hypothetical protein